MPSNDNKIAHEIAAFLHQRPQRKLKIKTIRQTLRAEHGNSILHNATIT